jgi:hypothetical protein
VTETSLLAIVVSVFLALLGVVWGMLREQNRKQGIDIEKVQARCAELENGAARLFERMKAREDAHAQHREDISERLSGIETKLDRLLEKLIAPRSATPSPTRYFQGPKKEE